MGTRTVYRGSRGRFAGTGGGKAETVRAGGFAHAGFQARFQAGRKLRGAPASGKTKASSPRRAPHQTMKDRASKIAHNRKVQVGAGVLVAGGAGYVAFNHVNPGTTLRKSGIEVPGKVTTFGGKNSARPQHSIVANKTHVFTTTTLGKGTKVSQHTVIEKIGAKGKRTPIGYIDSDRGRVTPGYRVSHTYLTSANRGKGLGKQALAAHAAHRPNRTYRASMNRSNMGQAFAKSVGGAGTRSGKSKAAGGDITKLLDRAWAGGTRTDRSGLAKVVTKKTKTMTPNKGLGKKVRGSKKLRS